MKRNGRQVVCDKISKKVRKNNGCGEKIVKKVMVLINL